VTTYYLACDLGAESGRLILGTLAEGKLTLEELHRFSNTPIRSGTSLHWNLDKLWEELWLGLKKAAARPGPISSISTDSWGVDYLLLAPDGSIMSPTYHYRDPRTKQGVENAFAKADWNTIFAETGIQFMVLNTLFQLAAEDSKRLAKARCILGIGDGFNYLLSGRAVIEESMASTFQLYNPQARAWSDSLIQQLGFPRRLFPEIVPSGTVLGPLSTELGKETGLSGMQVVASCSHDTGAAVAAVPASPGQWAYLSSGTWSLMGVQAERPVLTETCRELNFTNEIGFGGSVRLLKNIIGLWLVQECRRDWAQTGQEFDYAGLTRLASEAPPFGSLINPADPRFLNPDGMVSRIAEFCRQTDQLVPATPGATIRCILESLALLYRRTLLQIEQLIGSRIERLHIVGGGSKNELLNQFTANALQIPVIAGPAEATAAGNILVQAIALKHLSSLDAARQIIAQSADLRSIQPQAGDRWLEAYERFSRWHAGAVVNLQKAS
jgi:rhamnulokinase